MAEKRPTGEEIRQKMKEEYKKDLQARKEFLGKVEELRKKQKLTNAFVEITEAGKDDTDDLISQLNHETAKSEAKIEMALDSADIAADHSEKEAAFAMSEAEMAKIQAKEMVEKMKAEMAGNAEVKSEASSERKQESPSSEENVVDHRPTRKMLDDI